MRIVKRAVPPRESNVENVEVTGGTGRTERWRGKREVLVAVATQLGRRVRVRAQRCLLDSNNGVSSGCAR